MDSKQSEVSDIPDNQLPHTDDISVPANSNGYRLPNGRIPSRAQLAANRSLAFAAQTPVNATEAEIASEALESFLDLDIVKMRLLASNVFKAHKQAIEDGVFNWSEANYLKYALGYVALFPRNSLANDPVFLRM